MYYMESKVLKIGEPPIVGYLHHAYPLSVLRNHPNYEEWLCNNYIQIYCPKEILNSDIPNPVLLNFIWTWLDKNPLFDYIEVTPAVFNNFFKQQNYIKTLLKEAIDHDYCIYTFVDDFYMNKRLVFQKKHLTHELLIFGYDEKKDVLHTVGFNEKLEYSYEKLNAGEFKNAFIQKQENLNHLHLIKAKTHMEYPLDIPRIISLLQQYLDGENTHAKDGSYVHDDGFGYGIKIYGCLLEYLNMLKEKKVPCDIRAFHILWEHKKCMMDRMRYFIKNKKCNELKEISKDYHEVEEKAQYTRNLLIKYSIKQDNSILQKISAILQENGRSEEILLKKFIEIISRI